MPRFFQSRSGRLAVALGVLCLAGCTATRTTRGGLVLGVEPIPPSSRILVLQIANGVEAKEGPAQGTGRAVTSAVRDQLVSHGYVPLVMEPRDLVTAFEESKELGYRYLLRGEISAWEDNATEWSGRPDVAELSIEVYDVLSKSLIGSATHSIEGGDSAKQPIRFVPELADHALAKLFRWTPRTLTTY